jgi:hypothetical protein
MSDDHPPVYQHNGQTIYRASDLGGCITRLAAARQGQEKIPPAGKQLDIFTAGNEAEERFFEQNPNLAHYRQMEVTLHITPTIKIVGHLDALAEFAIIEVKSQSPEEFDKWTWDSWTDNPLWVKYSWQVSACMLAVGTQIHCTVWRINRETDKVDAVTVKEPFWTQDDIFARIMEVESLAHEDKLVCRTPDFFCSYPYLHTDDKEIVDDEELEYLVNKYFQVKKDLDENSAYAAQLRSKISERMDLMHYKKVLLMSGHQITKSEFDTKDHMVKGSHQVKVTITEAK